MSVTILVLVGYLVVLVGLALWGRGESHSLEGYYLAGKKLPFWVVAFSSNATGESGWLLLGLTGMGYLVGAQAYWVLVGEIIGLVASWGLISRKLKKLGDETNSITIPDVLSAKFDDRFHLIRGIAVAIILIMVTTYVTAQISATGTALTSFLGWDFKSSVFYGSVIIIGYTFIGGYKAVSYTDVVQGVLMLLGLILVPAAAIYASDGWSGVVGSLEHQDPDLLKMFALTSDGISGWVAILSFMAIGLPFLGVPQMLVRYMSARDDGEIRKARVMSIAVMIIYLGGAITAGIAGRALFPGLENHEEIFPTLSSNLFPAIVTGLLLVVVLSAIMSTVDSLLLLSSSAIVRDTWQKILGSKKSDAQLADYGKLVTLLIGAIGIVFAGVEAKFIFWFVLFAWAGLGAAFGPVILGLLYYKKITREGVIAGMLGGFLTTVIWFLFFKEQYYDLFEAIPGFTVGFLLTWGVSRLTWTEGEPAADGLLL
jgi:sodium/proline symporter